ncbi:MAG: hypothetical protein V3W34_19005 [Phycisphaerae bacterium]
MKPATTTAYLMIVWAAVASALTASGQSPAPQTERGETHGFESVGLAAPVSVAEALDRALIDLRIAETSQGPKATAALQRSHAFLNFAFGREPGNRRAKYYQGRMLVLSGRPQEALGRLRDWQKSRAGQNDWEVHFILGQVYQSIQFDKMAKPMLLKAVELNPREARCHSALARCAARLLDRETAIRHAREAIKLLGTEIGADAYMLLAEALLLNGQLAGAEQAGRFAKDLAMAEARQSGGSIVTLTKANQCVQLLLRIAQLKLQAHPDKIELYLETSRLIQEQADIAARTAAHQALEWAGRGLRKAGDQPPEPLLVDAARLLIRIGNTDAAAKVADRIIELYPLSKDARQILDQLRALPVDETPPTAGVHSP